MTSNIQSTRPCRRRFVATAFSVFKGKPDEQLPDLDDDKLPDAEADKE